MPDTPPIKRNFSSKSFSKSDKYFQINWYESYYPNLSHYEKTKWKPYAPAFKQPFHSLKKRDSYHRIKKLVDDKVATGVILYMKNNAAAFNVVDSLAQKLDIEIYPQIYNKHSTVNYPAQKLEDYKIKLLNNKNVNIYFNDDIHPENWDKISVDNFAHILRSKNKYLLSCSALINYEDKELNIIDNVDIIAPQLYPLRNKSEIKTDLFTTIPEYHNFEKYYHDLIELKKVVLDYNRTHLHQIYEGVTLADYHLNRANYAVISRFPSYKEFYYEFYTALICGVKEINIFANFASNEESYKNIKKIINKFRNSNLEKSIILGEYSPNAVEIKINSLQNEIDYCCYILDKKKYVIISNTSSKIQDLVLKNSNNNKMFLMNWETKKTAENITELELLLKPFEIKIFKIWR
jgi:hypothetical protein